MNEKKNDDSLLDNLKAAGASIGGVASDFMGRLREDRSEKTEGEDQETLLERLKEAAGDTRERLSGARSGDDIKGATSDFASRTDSIMRELFGSVRNAADGARESEAYDRVSSIVADTVGSVRGSVDDAVTKVRGQKADQADDVTADDADADAATRLDALMNRLRGDADPKVKEAGGPDIIEGEVVADSDVDGDTNTTNTDGK